MRKLAIIGASYLQEPLVRKAKEMRLYTICFAWKNGATCADICDKFYEISITEKEEILHICRQEGIAGICTIASDVAAPTVAYIANALGLVGNTYDAALRAQNKFLMRKALAAAAIPCPEFRIVKTASLPDMAGLHLPLIVKPTDRSGSLGVSKIACAESLSPALEAAISQSFGHEAIIEEYIEGREISVEFISCQGTHYPLQITDKVTTGAPHFVELAHHQPSSLPAEKFEYLYDLTRKALDALGITDGASHSEYKITKDGRVFVMEIAARMGGDFIGSDLVRLSTGYDFVKGVIDVALGEFSEPNITEHNHSGVYFLCKQTEELLPIIRNWKETPAFVRGEITDTTLHEAEKSADRSGYAIYKTTDSKYPIP